MSTLAEKFLKALEGSVTVGKFTFFFRRPTWQEAQHIPKATAAEGLLRHVTGWSNVTEMDVLPNGDGHPAVFDAEVCHLWLCDRPDLAGPVTKAIMDAYAAHVERLAELSKN